MTRLKLPYIHEFRDRHDRIRRYFRSRVGKRIPLPELPGSEEFMAAYQAALAGIDVAIAIGEKRTKPGTVMCVARVKLCVSPAATIHSRQTPRTIQAGY